MTAAPQLWLVLALATLTGCASTAGDVHLPLVWSRTHTADGKRDVEAMAGLYRHTSIPDPVDEGDWDVECLTVGPLYSLDREPDGDWTARYLVPFGLAHARGPERRFWLVPVASFEKRLIGQGDDTNWSFLSLVGLIGRGGDTRPTRFGWFPFFVRFDDFLVWDELTAVMFPLYVRSKIKERVSHHLVFPVFSISSGPGEQGFRIWPLYGRQAKEDRYDRTFLLWPLLHWQRNNLGGGGEAPQTLFMFWPFFGRTQQGTFEATTLLWPFFGWAKDPRSEFWAFDAPWPFIRFQRGPEDLERSRVWPFWGYLCIPGLRYTTFLWPLGHYKVEDNVEFHKRTLQFLPFWQSFDRVEKETELEGRWRKLWPLFQFEAKGPWQRGAFPTLDPFPPNQLYDRHYGWLTKLWEWENGVAGTRRERTWGGLYRRERTPREDRRSVAGLWSRRSVRNLDGTKRRETSLLFGLIRWRSGDSDDRNGLLMSAFPGPGWPELVGVPATLAPPVSTLQAPVERVEE
ncbi:MAG: hypothetical protein WD226_01505 [Planctomycetota bacterium]